MILPNAASSRSSVPEAGNLPPGTAAFRELPWRDRGVMLQSVALLAAIRLAVTIAGVRAVRHAMAATMRSPRHGVAPALDRVLVMSRLVDRASRHTVANTCLHRSLALWWLLGRRGIDSRLQVGVRRQGGRFEAHAWVEYGGLVVNDAGGGPGYAPLAWMPLEHES